MRGHSTAFALLLCCLVLGNITGVWAQGSVPGMPFASTQSAGGGNEGGDDAPSSDTSDGTDELRALRDILESPEAVAELREQLDTVIDGEVALAPSTPISPEATSGLRDLSISWREARPAAERLVEQLESYIWERLDTFRRTFERLISVIRGLPELVDWLLESLDEEHEWQSFGGVAIPLVGALLVGFVVMRGIAYFLQPVDRFLVPDEEPGFISKLFRAVLLTIVRAVPILLFAVALNIVILLISPDFQLRFALATCVTAVISVQVLMLIVRAVLAPHSPNARLVPISDAGVFALTRILHIIVRIAVYGSALILILGFYGLPITLGTTLQTALGIFVLVFLISVIIGHRKPVASALVRLAGPGEGRHWSEIPWWPISRVWHIVAILFTLALFIIYVVQGQQQFVELLGTVFLSLAVLVGLVWILNYVEHNESSLGGSLEELDDDDEQPAGGDARGRGSSDHDSPVIIFLRLAVGIAALLTFLEVWGLDTWGWLFDSDSTLSRAVLHSVMVIGVVYLLWLGISKFIATYMARLQARSTTERSTTRTQTALVLARNGIFVALCVIAVLSVLPQLGVDIGPLLAGAGVLGIAIGFGSQRLVQDIISGLFNLIEDNFAVGDVVDLGGKSGVVEAVTIRTVRLRDLGGNVHTIPFSAIDVVTNMTKEYSYAVFEIGVAYREKVDEVMRAIEETGQSLKRERAYRRVILDPLEMFGLDSFGDSSVNIKCRIKVRPGSQWMIMREFNRRLKQRFDDLGIEIPFPHQTIYFGVDSEGNAPPAHIALEGGMEKDGAKPMTPKQATAAS